MTVTQAEQVCTCCGQPVMEVLACPNIKHECLDCCGCDMGTGEHP